jgi:imidazole glycerol-phosphate synthase subunit HisF
MPMPRLIARLDVKGDKLIKSVQFEGLRVMGDPAQAAILYYEGGIDEILYVDPVASLYGRNGLHDILRRTVKDVFVPITAVGGIRCVDDARAVLRSGADKVGVNTAALHRPELIGELAAEFGSQCVVLSVEAKLRSDGTWECFVENGREATGREPAVWASEAVERGAGEVIITSVDREGTRRGFDDALAMSVRASVNVPLIASGGMGKIEHVVSVLDAGADGAAIADGFHYGRWDVASLRAELIRHGVGLRR